MKIKLMFVFAIFTVLSCTTAKTKLEPGQHSQVYETLFGKRDYLLHLPENYYESDEKIPLILYLHGRGDLGMPIDWMRDTGPAKVAEGRENFPFIVATPAWNPDNKNELKNLRDFLNYIIKHYRVDEDRIYLTGLSMGGYGTWYLATAYPEYFAAIAPICGGGEPEKAERIKNIPAWVFHGAKDNLVPISESERMVEALTSLGANIEFTVFPERRHDVWTPAYKGNKLYDWFLTHKR